MSLNAKQFKAYCKLGDFLKRTAYSSNISSEANQVNQELLNTLSCSMVEHFGSHQTDDTKLHSACDKLNAVDRSIADILISFKSLLAIYEHQRVVEFILKSL